MQLRHKRGTLVRARQHLDDDVREVDPQCAKLCPISLWSPASCWPQDVACCATRRFFRRMDACARHASRIYRGCGTLARAAPLRAPTPPCARPAPFIHRRRTVPGLHFVSTSRCARRSWRSSTTPASRRPAGSAQQWLMPWVSATRLCPNVCCRCPCTPLAYAGVATTKHWNWLASSATNSGSRSTGKHCAARAPLPTRSVRIAQRDAAISGAPSRQRRRSPVDTSRSSTT